VNLFFDSDTQENGALNSLVSEICVSYKKRSVSGWKKKGMMHLGENDNKYITNKYDICHQSLWTSHCVSAGDLVRLGWTRYCSRLHRWPWIPEVVRSGRDKNKEHRLTLPYAWIIDLGRAKLPSAKEKRTSEEFRVGWFSVHKGSISRGPCWITSHLWRHCQRVRRATVEIEYRPQGWEA
jgi:hypothetical protein